MNRKHIPSTALGELVVMYTEAARVHATATESGDYKKANRAADLLAAIYAELRRRGQKSQMALLPLLSHDDPGVRGWAASHALEFSASDGQRVLEDLIATNKGFLGLDAKTTLEEWRKGRLRFP